MAQVAYLTKSEVISPVLLRELVKTAIKIIIKSGLIGTVAYHVFTANADYQSSRVMGVKSSPVTVSTPVAKIDTELTIARKALVILSCPSNKIETLAESIVIGSKVAGVSPVLIAALIATESNFDEKAVSHKHYVGLMQTRSKTGYMVADIVHGAAVLKEKLSITHGQLLPALQLYKGGRNATALSQARKVIALADHVHSKMRG